MRSRHSAASRVATFTLLALCGFSVRSGAADSPQSDLPISTPRVHAAPSGQHGFPFMSSSLNLKSVGYVEEEFFISGTAQAFIPAQTQPLQPDGRWNVEPNPGVTAPYTTRILVRRPQDPQRFNGTVVVEWFNETADFDAPSDWLYEHEEIVREGYAYVGVTAQFVGVKALKGWEKGPGARYASLFHPGESFAYDIFAQTGWVVSHARNTDPQPLGDLTRGARTVLATGFSQSADWLATYVNAIHKLYPVFQGFLIHDGAGGIPLSLDIASFDGDPIPANVPVTPLINTPYPVRVRTDLKVPTLIVLSEFGLSDTDGAGRSFHLESDTDHIRVWELAGATHLETGWFGEFAADMSKSAVGFALGACDGPPGIPNIVHAPASRAALHALNRWANDGELPRSAPRISLVVPNPPHNFNVPVVFNRDPATNLVIGGIRLPAISVPTATLNGNRTDLEPKTLGPGLQCFYVGSLDPWNHDGDRWDGKPGVDPSPTPEPVLQLLYPTHENYVDRVAIAASQSKEDGYLRPADAAQIVLKAEKSHVP
jgi:hypothetical protein